jgi:hypothetical protein
MEIKKQRIIKVVISEVEVITRNHTYEVLVEETETEDFIETMNWICGHNEIYDELSNYEYRYLSCEDGEKYHIDDECPSFVDKVEVLNQLPLSL